MNKKIKIPGWKRSYINYGIALVAGLVLGGLLFSGRSGKSSTASDEEAVAQTEQKQVWTCSMHPQIKQDKPGKCPICGMDLIPLRSSSTGGDTTDPAVIQLSPEAVALANIQTTKVGRQSSVKEIQLYGTIQPDERLSQSQTSHVSGRIESLAVNFTGEQVRRGQTIATIYSPDLLNAQQELVEANRMQPAQPALIQAAREKLRLWKLTDEQIAAIEQSGKASALVEIKAGTNGIVVRKNVNQGDYVSQGDVLYDVADLSRVWAVFNAYEVDLPFLKVGNSLEYTLQALPGRTFTGKISFINPIVDPVTRTAQVRVETSNAGGTLKPEMYASATVRSGINLRPDEIVIPQSAVLWTGKRSIVYVKQEEANIPSFKLREIELGPFLGNAYIVESGLHEGEEIVTNGVFTIDASAQLEGKQSMMNESASAL